MVKGIVMETRYTIQVIATLKGIKTYRATVDILGDTDLDMQGEALKASDRLVAELDKRYPLKRA